jgi:hypothetical protein
MPKKFKPFLILSLMAFCIIAGILIIPDAIKFMEYGYYPPMVIHRFADSKSEFISMTEKMITLRGKYHEAEELTLWLGEIGSRNAEITLSSGTTMGMELSNDELQCLEKIQKAIGNNEILNRIIVSDNRVTYLVEGNGLAIIFSINGETPGYILKKDEISNIKVVPLDKDWYLLLNRS